MTENAPAIKVLRALDASWLWQRVELAEVQLTLCCPKQVFETASKMLLHSVVLASGSEYFKGRLLSGVGQLAERGISGYMELTEAVETDEISAAMAVIHDMYTCEHKPSSSFADRLAMLKIADRWQVSGAIQAYQEALVSLSLTKPDVQALLRLPPGLRTSITFTPAIEAAQVWLLGRLCSSTPDSVQPALLDVADLLVPGQLNEALLRLQHKELVHLLRHKCLAADSENSVISLLTFWLALQPTMDPPMLEELLACVRLARLSPAYLVDVVCVIDRLGQLMTPDSKVQLLRFQAASHRVQRELLRVGIITGPPGWYDLPRLYAASEVCLTTALHSNRKIGGGGSNCGCCVALCISEAQLRGLLPPGADDTARPLSAADSALSMAGYVDDLQAKMLYLRKKLRVAGPDMLASAEAPAAPVVKDVVSDTVVSNGFAFRLRFAVHWPLALAFVGLDASAHVGCGGCRIPLPNNLSASVRVEVKSGPSNGRVCGQGNTASNGDVLPSCVHVRENLCMMLGTGWSGWNDMFGLDDCINNPLGTTLSAYRPFMENGALHLTAHIWNIDAC